MRAERVEQARCPERAIALLAGRTHPISATIVADLARGEGPEPLHELALELLDAGRDGPNAATIARVAAIGHQSGRDLLAGFLAGMIGVCRALPETFPIARTSQSTTHN